MYGQFEEKKNIIHHSAFIDQKRRLIIEFEMNPRSKTAHVRKQRGRVSGGRAGIIGGSICRIAIGDAHHKAAATHAHRFIETEFR